MIDKKSWKEFRDSGMLWWVNRTLHLFGWSIVFDYENEYDEHPTKVYPAKTKWRGFEHDVEAEGFKNVTNHIKDNIEELVKDCNE